MDPLHTLSLDRLNAMLAEAIEARHKLVIRPTSASGEGRSIQYAQRVADADAYIERLNQAVRSKESPQTATRGPIYLQSGGCW